MQEIVKAVEKHRALVVEAEKFLWAHPETGYREKATSAYLEEQFEKLGYELVKADGITGFYTRIDTGRAGPEVMILAELDAVVCPTHPAANADTGAVHACGHHAQCAALLGIAAALKEEKILDGLSGKIRLCAVPAEELLEIGYRRELKKQGKIKYFGGKSEFLSRGMFDGVDIAFMVHTSWDYKITGGSVGCVVKEVIYKGVSAHAGGAPERGRNALYAAMCGINAVNALRETFVESDRIRVHPIITQGGATVNAIPEAVRLESYVRGVSAEAIKRENEKIDRALIGGALSIGTNIEILDAPGYFPLTNDSGMIRLAEEAAAILKGKYSVETIDDISGGSTDMGDMSSIMPVIHPYAGGAAGVPHGSDYKIVDVDAACIDNAKWQIAMLTLLLQDRAARAKRIIKEFKPQFASKEEFLAYQDAIFRSGDRIEYREDGTATVR